MSPLQSLNLRQIHSHLRHADEAEEEVREVRLLFWHARTPRFH